jgi:hypothetical protein
MMTTTAAKHTVMILAPAGLVAFSLSHGTLSWSDTQHLWSASVAEWAQHLSTIRTRWLAAHLGGILLFPMLGMTIWWMLPTRGVTVTVAKIALAVYMPLYVAVDAVLGIGSSILIDYRDRLSPMDRAGAEGAFAALFFEASVIDWLDHVGSIAWEIGALTSAIALWRDFGWRVSVPLAAAGWILTRGHFPPFGAMAGLALGIAVWQYLMLERRARAALLVG